MAYGSIKEVAGTIAEREYAVGDKITTTAITSCIVVATTAGSKVFAIHLSIFGTPDAFDVTAADAVADAMSKKGCDMNNVHIYGEIDFWGDSIPGYKRLMEVLGHPQPSRMHQKSGIVTISRADV